MVVDRRDAGRGSRRRRPAGVSRPGLARLRSRPPTGPSRAGPAPELAGALYELPAADGGGGLTVPELLAELRPGVRGDICPGWRSDAPGVCWPGLRGAAGAAADRHLGPGLRLRPRLAGRPRPAHADRPHRFLGHRLRARSRLRAGAVPLRALRRAPGSAALRSAPRGGRAGARLLDSGLDHGADPGAGDLDIQYLGRVMSHRIAVIPGDGVGKEVIPEGIKVLSALGLSLEFEQLPWGCDHYQRTGRMMPDDALAVLARFDAIYLGAIGWPTVPDHVSLWGCLLPIRKTFDQYVNLRPVRLPPGVRSPLAGRGPAEVDMLFVRENTEGEYSGAGGRVHQGTPAEVAVEVPVFTRRAIERCVRYAFERARERRRRLISVTKSNASRYAYVLWDEVVAGLAPSYPEVEVERVHVDAMAARMVLRPDTVDVVVGSNLFADVLTDLGAALQGSLGLAASANLSLDRAGPSMFEPVHGSAPDIAGRSLANPMGAVWSAALMLRHLGHEAEADRVERAIDRVCAEGRFLTGDLGGSATTSEVGDAIVRALGEPGGRP